MDRLIVENKKMNNLTGKEWLQFSFSVWRDIRKDFEEIKLKHPAIFPKQLTDRLISIYTKNEGEIVLDPFMGSGSTILSAYRLGKKGIGIDLLGKYVSLAKKRLSRIKQKQELFSQRKSFDQLIIKSNAISLDKYIDKNSIDFCVTSPPYWDILNQARTSDKKINKSYSSSRDDLGNIKDYKFFLTSLSEIFKKVFQVLKKDKRCVVIVMDIRKKSKFYPLHMNISKMMMDIGFELEDVIIWDRQREYNNMRPLGYPFVFRVNKVHEYILIFKKN